MIESERAREVRLAGEGDEADAIVGARVDELDSTTSLAASRRLMATGGAPAVADGVAMSRACIEPLTSTASMMSIPEACTCTFLRSWVGRASATTRSAAPSQRSAGSKRPQRVRRTRAIERTRSACEYGTELARPGLAIHKATPRTPSRPLRS